MIFQYITSVKEEVVFPKKRKAKISRNSKIAEPISQIFSLFGISSRTVWAGGPADHFLFTFIYPFKLLILNKRLPFNNENQLFCGYTELYQHPRWSDRTSRPCCPQSLKLHTFNEEIWRANKHPNSDQIELPHQNQGLARHIRLLEGRRQRDQHQLLTPSASKHQGLPQFKTMRQEKLADFIWNKECLTR